MLLYYRFIELSPEIQVVSIFTSICVITFIFLVIGNIHHNNKKVRRNRGIQRLDEKYKAKIIEIAQRTDLMDLNDITEELDIPKNDVNPRSWT